LRLNFSEEHLGALFLTTKDWRNFGSAEIRTSWLERKKI